MHLATPVVVFFVVEVGAAVYAQFARHVNDLPLLHLLQFHLESISLVGHLGQEVLDLVELCDGLPSDHYGLFSFTIQNDNLFLEDGLIPLLLFLDFVNPLLDITNDLIFLLVFLSGLNHLLLEVLPVVLHLLLFLFNEPNLGFVLVLEQLSISERANGFVQTRQS